MTTPAPPLGIDNYGTNNPYASTDKFPPSFPGGRALLSAVLDQLTFAEVDKDSWHARAPLGEVASTWTINQWGELRESRRIINDEWVCFFEYPRGKGFHVRCVLIRENSAATEVWYRGCMRDQKLELALVIPSVRGNAQDIELHLKGATTLQHKWHDREFAQWCPGLGQPERAMVHVEKASLGNENTRTETVVMTNSVVMIKHPNEGPGETTTHIRDQKGDMCIFGPAKQMLRLQAPRGGPDAWGTIVHYYRVDHRNIDYADRELMLDGTWKMAPGRQPPKDTRPNVGDKRGFQEVGLTAEQQEAAEDEAEQSLEHDGAADEAQGEREYVTEAPTVKSDDEDDFNGP